MRIERGAPDGRNYKFPGEYDDLPNYSPGDVYLSINQ